MPNFAQCKERPTTSRSPFWSSQHAEHWAIPGQELVVVAWTEDSCCCQSLERESNRSDSKMRARHLLSCLTDGEILVLLSSQSVELVHGMLSIHFCILLPKSNWSLLLSCSPARLSLPARGCSVFPITATEARIFLAWSV